MRATAALWSFANIPDIPCGPRPGRNKAQRERSDRRGLFHPGWAWLGRRRRRGAAIAKHRAGSGALALTRMANSEVPELV